MSKVQTDELIKKSLSEPAPRYVVSKTQNQVITTTWAPITISESGADFFYSTFNYTIWDGESVRPPAGITVSQDFHLRFEFRVDSKTLLANYISLLFVPYRISDNLQYDGFAAETFVVDKALAIPLLSTGSYNENYNLSPFYVAPDQYYKILARTDVGTVTIGKKGISLVRNN